MLELLWHHPSHPVNSNHCASIEGLANYAGTGKTHTVRGILNVWHIVHYNRFLGSLVSALSK